MAIQNWLIGGFYGILGLAITEGMNRNELWTGVFFHCWIATLALLWLGFVLAISCMEAWVKFQAPFLPKFLAFDVGRTVFPALNSAEMAFCVNMWWSQVRHDWRQSLGWNTSHTYLCVISFILIVEVLVLTPALVLRGKEIIYKTITEKKDGGELTFPQKIIMKELKIELTQKLPPPRWMHHLYMLFELVKVGILVAFVLHVFSSLALLIS